MNLILQGGNPPSIPGRITPAAHFIVNHAANIAHVLASLIHHCR